MRKAYTFLVLGIWLAVLPYLGFPYSWKDMLTTATGIGIICFSFMIYREVKRANDKKEESFDNFSENNFFND